MKISNTIFTIIFLAFAALILLVAQTFSIYAESKSINENCSGMDLFMTSKCLNKELNSFYKYNLSNMNKELSFEELKREGGVCKDFSEWIKYKFMKLGAKYDNQKDKLIKIENEYKFYVTDVSFSTGNETGHKIVIASNKEGYCIFSNQYYECMEFNNETD